MKKANIVIRIFFSFFKISMFTFGGGYAIVPLLKLEIVEKNKWISDEELTDILSMSQVIPGIVFISISSFIGYKLAGLIGAICASLAVIFPSVLSMMILISFYHNYSDSNVLKRILIGIICGVTALTIEVLIDLLRKISGNQSLIAIFLIALFLLEALNIQAPLIVVISILFGFLYSHSKLNRR